MYRAPTASKRLRNEEEDDESSQLHPKKLKEEPVDVYLIVHSVGCEGDSYHSHHKQHAYYLDPPRLFGKDDKANALRGAHLIEDLEQFLDEANPEYNFVVERRYSCEAYYKLWEKEFEEIGNSRFRSKFPSEERAYLYTLRRNLPAATPEDERITHFSQNMAKALNALDGICHWNGMFDTDDPGDLELKEPYLNIYHSRTALCDYQKANVNRSHWRRLDSFRDYILEAMSDGYAEADAYFQRSETTPRHLAKLFRRGDIVITQRHGEETGLSCIAVSSPEPRLCNLTCQSWTFDGSFRKRTETLQVTWPAYSSAKAIPIASLKAYPLRFGAEDLKDRLKKRGQMLWECRFRKYVSYNEPASASDIQTPKLRFMIDMATYNMLHQAEAKEPHDMAPFPQEVLGDADMKGEDPPGDEFLLTLPTKIPGFGFHNKRWVDLSLRHVESVEFDGKAFQKLVMDEQKKELLGALVKVQSDRSQSRVPDVIEGKGNGLILLLHGPPGTGKTLTAESVAELANRPLYRVTCGDIGTQPEDIERYLDSVLFIGKTWDCVVLLDEADIFLEERSASDLQRNALVSIFLRVLEYYDGILILTTNRVGTFDEAFKSRIQLAVHYPALKKDDREHIWRLFLSSIKGGTEVDDYQIAMLAKHELNGRQIRNTIKTASQQAFHQERRLSYVHLQTAIGVANEFEDYIRRARGQTDEESAFDNGARAMEHRE